MKPEIMKRRPCSNNEQAGSSGKGSVLAEYASSGGSSSGSVRVQKGCLSVPVGGRRAVRQLPFTQHNLG
jgi:hypothetical protein